jgi:hypothetical protein
VQRVNRAACATNRKLTVAAVVLKGMTHRASVRLRWRSPLWAQGVSGRGGKTVQESLVEVLHGLGTPGLIAFDGEEVVVALLLHHDAGRLGLRVQGVGGDQRALKVGPFEQRPQRVVALTKGSLDEQV